MDDPNKDTPFKYEIIRSLKDAMINHPPLKTDIYEVLVEIKKAYPELIALKKPMGNLPDIISETTFTLIPYVDIYTIIEKKLETEPFHDDLAMDTFAYIMWLASILIFKEEFKKQTL